MSRTTAPSALPDFLNELAASVGGDVRADTVTRVLYSTDASIYQVMPHAVFFPRSAAEIQAAVTLAARYRIPVVARGGGSSLAGQAIGEALIIDTTRHLDQLLEVDRAARWARVQPGMVLDDLNAQLRPHGLQFGPDPASSNRAVVGGIVSNNSTGSHSIVYGMAADHIRAADVILADGSHAHFASKTTQQIVQYTGLSSHEAAIYRGIAALTTDPANRATIVRGTPRHWRRCGGYNLDRFVDDNGINFHRPRQPAFNLAELVCGAEGTLGVLSEVTLNLVPVPTQTALTVLQFDELAAALQAVPVILEVEPTAVELLDNLQLTLCRDVPQYARLLQTFVAGSPHCLLITEFTGESEAELKAKLARLTAHLAQRGVRPSGATPILSADRQHNVWGVRKAGLGLLMSIKGDHKPLPFIEDAAVPVEHLAEYVLRLERFCAELGTRVAYYAHASAGCLHFRPLINTKDAQDVAKLPEILDFAVSLLGEYGGVLSSEHGDGRARSWLNRRFFGEDLYNLYAEVKQIFDPENLFNPGNIVDGPAMTENLRISPDDVPLTVETHLDFSRDISLHHAVEMCNGAGVCRKRTSGTMCPSFQATREERDSTRGRANMLRAVLTGRLPAAELTGQRLYDVMSLCVSCKACKAECPSSVDMGRIKTEFLAQYQAANGVPLRSRIFGNIASLSRLSSGWRAPLANAALTNRFVKQLLGRTLGIAPERSLPTFARQPFTTWFRRRAQAAAGRPVTLFNDTFHTYNEPHIAIAATEVLEAAGCHVSLPGHGCCGRPAFSKGMVARARAQAAETVDRLAPLAEQGPIVVLEPSCLSMLIDEYAVLLPDDARVAAIAARAVSFETYVNELLTTEPEALQLRRERFGRALFHGHCHQKALIGTADTVALLETLGYKVDAVDSGCCGMAGSFGYEAEHRAVSLKMAERRLLPAVRQASRVTPVVAAGTSCRHQIAGGTQRRARHPAELVRDALLDRQKVA